MIKSLLVGVVVFFAFGCLKTRTELGQNYQSQMYSKKQADNQSEQLAQQSNEPPAEPVKVDEKDELIRNLNGRIEVLENQISLMQKEKSENTDAQKIQILQESLTKMEAQLAKIEAEASMKSSDSHVAQPAQHSQPAVDANQTAASSTDKIKEKKSSFDVAQDFFVKKDFKNAILEYQKFLDANSKGKSKQIPEAKYKIGLCFESLGLKDEAQSFYEEVAAQHAQTEFGKKAKQKISKNKK